MSAEDVAARVLRHLARHEQWLRKALEESNVIEKQTLDVEALADAVAQQRVMQRDLQTLVEEQRLLLRDWQEQQEAPDSLREQVRQRAQPVMRLVEQTRAEQERLINRLEEAAAQCGASLGAVRRQRRLLGPEEAQHVLDERG